MSVFYRNDVWRCAQHAHTSHAAKVKIVRSHYNLDDTDVPGTSDIYLCWRVCGLLSYSLLYFFSDREFIFERIFHLTRWIVAVVYRCLWWLCLSVRRSSDGIFYCWRWIWACTAIDRKQNNEIKTDKSGLHFSLTLYESLRSHLCRFRLALVLVGCLEVPSCLLCHGLRISVWMRSRVYSYVYRRCICTQNQWRKLRLPFDLNRNFQYSLWA